MLKPVDTWIIAIREGQTTKSPSGIIIPNTARENRKVALVLEVGPKVTFCKQGDKVVFGNHAGDEFDEEGIKYMIIKEDEIMALYIEDTK